MIRIASAVLLITAVVVTIWWLPAWASIALATAVAAGGAAELARLSARYDASVPAGFLPATAAIVAMAFVLDSITLTPGVPVLHVVLLATVVAAGAVTLVTAPPGPGTLTRASVAALAPLYVGLPLGALASIRAVEGAGALFLLIAIVAASDTAQYYGGRALGRRKLAPAVSPGKTIEGAVAGLVAGTIVAAFAGPWLLAPILISPVAAGVLGAGLSLAGMIGDLFESLLKRGAGVKDSSALIPGHGGVLDRIDSYLFAGPVYFAFLRLT